MNIVKLGFCFLIVFNTLAYGGKEKKVIGDQKGPKENDQVSKVTENEKEGLKNSLDDKPNHILMFHPWNTKSHRIMQNSLLEGLLARGHQVTGVFPQSSNIKNKLYTEIVVPDGFAQFMDIMTKSMLEKDKDSTNPLQMISLWPEMFRKFGDLLRDNAKYSKEVIESIKQKNETVDAVIMTAQFLYLGGEIFRNFRAPQIGISPPGWAQHTAKYLGNPENPAYQPELSAPFIEPMTFMQRLSNTLLYSISDYDILGWIYYSLVMDTTMLDVDLFREQIGNISLLLLGSHFVTHSPLALASNIIEVGGLHCREGEKLPDDLQLYLDSHPEGVVYVSFGSTVQSSKMPAERKQVFLDTFRQLDHPVIWKWDEDDIPNLPPNVKLSKWLPQQDLLAHPNLRVFVTHGGLLSTQEALYHQTPLVGIPLGNDQKPNMLRAEKRGYAIMLDWSSINSDQFLAAINRAMDDEELKENMKQAHDLFVDARDPPLDRAVWWVEYIIRHKGAQFLKPHSLDLSWYQYHLLDVITFIVITTFCVTFIMIKLLLCCCRCCCARKLKTE